MNFAPTLAQFYTLCLSCFFFKKGTDCKSASAGENYESIYWYLKQANKKLNIVTIHTVSQKDVTELTEENTGKADFTIAVDEDMTKTR